MTTKPKQDLHLVAGQGDMGGGEHMLLRIGEVAQDLGWSIAVVGPGWGDLQLACETRGFRYVRCRGTNRRSYTVAAAICLARPGLGLVWANGALPALAATATPNPLIVHLHQRPTRPQRLAVNAAMARARCVLVPSESMREAVPEALVMFNWTENLDPLVRQLDPQTFTIAYLGRLSAAKGLDTLATAASAMARKSGSRRVRLLIAGDTRFVHPDSAARVNRALDACAAEVVRLGWVAPVEVLSAADVLVVPSRVAESFGLAAAEAMARECPVVVSDAGGLPEVVGHDYPWIFPAGDAQALSAQLERLMAGQVVVSLRSRWEELFSPSAGYVRVAGVLEDRRTGRLEGGSWG